MDRPNSNGSITDPAEPKDLQTTTDDAHEHQILANNEPNKIVYLHGIRFALLASL